MAKQVQYKIRFQLDPDAKLTVAHGVWGGITPHGEIEMNFFSECEDLPESVLRTVDEVGSVMEEEAYPSSPEERGATRTVTSRIIINRDTAHALSDWLSEQIDILEDYQSYQASFKHDQDDDPDIKKQ